MSLVLNSVFDGGTARLMVAGDIINMQETLQSIANAAGVTWTAANIITGILQRSGAAAVSDTTPDASSLVNALLANGGYQGGGAYSAQGIQAGSTFRLRLLNANTGTLTLVAGAGCTLSSGPFASANAPTVAASEYLLSITNGTPPQTYAATTTNASAVITGMTADQTKNITPGMSVSGTGIPASATVLSVQPGVGFTLSANATATGALIALAFTPNYTMRKIM